MSKTIGTWIGFAVDLGSLWRALSSQWCGATVASPGLEQPKAPTSGSAARRRGPRALEAVRLAQHKKSVETGGPLWALRMKAASRCSRRSNAPELPVVRRRSCAPASLIMTALTSLGRCSSRRAAATCDCTSNCMPTTSPATTASAFWPGAPSPSWPIVLVWDNHPTQRRKLVQHFLARHPRLHVFPLPSYAPKLNPAEYLCTQRRIHGGHGPSQCR